MRYIPTDFLDELNASLTGIDTSDCRITGRLEVYVCKSMGQDKKLYKQLEKQYHDDKQAKDSALLARNIHRNSAGVEDGILLDCQVDISDNEPLSATAEVLQYEAAPFGSMNDSHTRKVLFHLIACLNMAFPEYEFSSVKASHFRKHSVADAVHKINSIMDTVTTSASPKDNTLARKFWAAVQEAIGPNTPENISACELAPDSSASKTSLPNSFERRGKRRRVISLTDAEKNSIMNSSSTQEWQSDVDIFTYEPDDSTGAGDPYADEDEENATIWRFFYLMYNHKVKRILFFSMHAVGNVVAAPSIEWDAEEQPAEIDTTPLSSQSKNTTTSDTILNIL